MLDYRKVADLCSRGASTNAIAQAFRCKWETVDLAICRMQAKWGSLEKIPAELDNIGIRNELFRKSKVADGDYLQPDFSSLPKADRRKQNNELWEAYCRKVEFSRVERSCIPKVVTCVSCDHLFDDGGILFPVSISWRFHLHLLAVHSPFSCGGDTHIGPYTFIPMT